MADRTFLIQRSALCIRSVWYQRHEHAQAHILVCFLARVLWEALSGLRRVRG